MADASRSQTNAPGKAMPRRRRWLKVMLWCLAVLMITVGVGIWIVTRSWFIIQKVQPELERRLGGPVQIADASYVGGGDFVFRGVVLRAPGHRGKAGEVLRLDRVDLSIDPSTILSGSPTLRAVHIDGARLRLSEQQRQPGRFNFMTLDPDWETDAEDQEVNLPPKVEIQNLIVEVGMHDGADYASVGSRRLAGQMYASRDEKNLINFELGEVSADGAGLGDRGLHVNGQWNVQTNEHTSRLDGLALNERTYAMCPQIVREWWDRMDLQGRVEGVSVSWQTDQPLTMRFDVEDVALTIPVETSEIWARYRDGHVESTPSRPRMRVSSGAIRLEGDHLSLENLQGELGSTDSGDVVVSVPYTIRLEIPSLPKIDWDNRQAWLANSLQKAAFDMHFEMKGFSLSSDDAFSMPAVDLPRVVAEALERFRMTGWVLDTKVEVHRDPPIEEPDGTLVAQQEQWHGQAYIKNAACTYENFRYPLEDVEAFLTFDREQVNLEYLYGYGSEHTRIRISGLIAPPSEQAAIDLTVQAKQVPIDDELRAALRPDQQAVFDALLHEPSYAMLRDAGLLADDGTIEQTVQQRDALVASMTELRRSSEQGGDPPAEVEARLEAMRREMDRLNRVINAGPFVLGGYVDLDLHIHREFGRHKEITVTGAMALSDGGLVYEKFPYPLHVTGGAFDWQRDRIVIVENDEHDGITFTTPGGGQGHVTGAVLFSSASTTGKVEPQLSIQVIGDRLNEALYAAIPAGESDGPADDAGATQAAGPSRAAAQPRRSAAADLLAALGLHGALDYNGLIRADDDGRIDFGFLVQIRDATASPGEKLSKLIGESGLYWPEGFDIADVEADLWISRDAIELNALKGRHDAGVVRASGNMNLTRDPPAISMLVDFLDLPIGEYLVDLAPREGVERARALWDRYEPTGSFDATLRYETTSTGDDPAELQLRPMELTAMVDGQPVTFKRAGGSLQLSGGRVHFDELALTLTSSGRNEGRMLLNGTYGVLRGDENLEMNGTWQTGQLASPIVTEAMRLIGAEQEAAQFSELEPSGSFDAEFSYRSPQGSTPRTYRLVMHPGTVDVHVNDTAVQLAMDERSAVVIEPGVMRIDHLSGTLGDGRFTTSGSARIGGDTLDIDLDIDYRGQLSHPAVQAILPQPAREALAAIEFADGNGSHLRQAELHLQRAPAGDGNSTPAQRWSTRFAGLVDTDHAAFIGGVPFDEVDGTFSIDVEYEPDRPPALTIEAAAPHLRVFETTMTDAEATITLASADELVVRGFRSEMFGGAVAAQATFGVGERRGYTADVSMAGVEVAGLMQDETAEDAVPYDRTSTTARKSGKVFASASVQGVRGQTSARTGRGTIRIADGRMARMPLLLGLLQLMELMPPLSDSLNFADADFYIEGGSMVFDDILVECPTLQLRGQGTMNLATMDVDVLFRSRGTLAIVGDIVGGISDQLYGIRVSGPLTAPDAELVPLPGLSSAPEAAGPDVETTPPAATAAR